MKDKIALIGSSTLGTPTEIYEALHGNHHEILIIADESKTATFKIENIITKMPDLYFPPMTRKERRKLKQLK